MAVTAAQLKVVIAAETAGAEKGIASVSGLLGKALPLAAVGAAAAVVGIGIMATKMAGDFESGTETLVTGAGEAQSKLGMVRDGILNMAVSTGTSTKQLTDGMFMIESAGFHGANGLNVLKAAAQGAKVGQADLGTVADATTTIMKDYPHVMNGAAGAVNTLIATVQNGKTKMGDLAGALSQILPTASSAHVGLNDVMGAMATMTGEGVPAANAATYLRQTIIALDAPSKQAKTALASVGLTTDEVSKAMQKSLPTAINMITEAVGKKFPAGSAAYVQALKDISGGSKTMQGMLDLSGQHMQDFINNTKSVASQVKQGGNQIVGWNAVQGTFNQKLDKAREVVETFMIRLGTGLLPIAGKLVDFFSANFVPTLTNIFNGIMSVVNAIGSFIGWLQKGGAAADAVKILLLALGGAMAGLGVKALVDMIPAIIESVTAFGAQAIAAGAAAIATLAAAAPFIAIGAAIGAVVGIIILAVTHWKQITEAIGHFGDMVGHAAQLVKAGFDIIAHMNIPVISGIAGMVSKGISLVSHMVDVITGKAEEMRLKAAMHADAMKVKQINTFQEMAEKSISTIQKQKEGILAQLAQTTDPAKRHALEMKLKVLNEHQALLEQSVKIAQQRKEKILAHEAELRQEAIRHAMFMKMGILGHVAELGYNMVSTIVKGVTNFLNTLGSFKDKAIAWAGNFVTGILNGLASLPGKFLALGGQIIQNLANGITGAYGTIKNAISNIPVVGGAVGFIGNFIPHFAAGGRMKDTGIAVVGEEGPELVQLPGGSQVTPIAKGQSSSKQPLPTGLSQAFGLATAQQGGKSVPVNVYIDRRMIAQIVLEMLPTLIRNATGARNF